MKSLLLVAHGSRKTSSNDAVKQLVDKLRLQLSDSGFASVTHAFLELTEPTVIDGVNELVSAGSTSIVVIPYFLAPGTHVVDDVPELVGQAKKMHPTIEFSVTSHLGEFDGLIGFILQSAEVSA